MKHLAETYTSYLKGQRLWLQVIQSLDTVLNCLIIIILNYVCSRFMMSFMPRESAVLRKRPESLDSSFLMIQNNVKSINNLLVNRVKNKGLNLNFIVVLNSRIFPSSCFRLLLELPERISGLSKIQNWRFNFHNNFCKIKP